jgi:hypothetical protein
MAGCDPRGGTGDFRIFLQNPKKARFCFSPETSTSHNFCLYKWLALFHLFHVSDETAIDKNRRPFFSEE